ncbi:MAG: excinuclease ABC subunit A, partial [Pseudohongiellaceae bacterium]
MLRNLIVRGAREHNLRACNLSLPLGQWIAVVGPSGSGKTSLVFDTIVREGQRRFLGALSARARHFYGKLGWADVDAVSGLPATIAVGQHTATENVRSTVGTLSGGLDLLRLLYARCAIDPEGVPLTRSHFSFNQTDGACESCQGVGIEDQVDPELLVEDPGRSIRGGALRPTLKNGYTVYSQVTVEVLNDICQVHGFTVDTPWQELSAAQQQVIFYGTKALKVPFGKHSIASRMRWEGITARPREEGYYPGLIPVIAETLKRNRNPNVLRFVRSIPCQTCAGSRLGRPGREALLGRWSLPALLAEPAAALRAALDELPHSDVLSALRPSLEQRLTRMEQLGLGHLSLDRSSPSLSGGEAQRLRLAAQLTAGLGRQLIALDEPTLGLHPSGQQGMSAVLDELRDLGNTLLVVEHDPDMVRRADHLVRLGPGAGSQGGQVIESSALAADGSSPLGVAPERKAAPRQGRG